jgi:hypothetical protein
MSYLRLTGSSVPCLVIKNATRMRQAQSETAMVKPRPRGSIRHRSTPESDEEADLTVYDIILKRKRKQPDEAFKTLQPRKLRRLNDDDDLADKEARAKVEKLRSSGGRTAHSYFGKETTPMTRRSQSSSSRRSKATDIEDSHSDDDNDGESIGSSLSFSSREDKKHRGEETKGATTRRRSLRLGSTAASKMKQGSSNNEHETLSEADESKDNQSSDDSQGPRNIKKHSPASAMDDEKASTEVEANPGIQNDKSATSESSIENEPDNTSFNSQEDSNIKKRRRGETKGTATRRRSIRLGSTDSKNQGNEKATQPKAKGQEHQSNDGSRVPRTSSALPMADEKAPTTDKVNQTIREDEKSVTDRDRTEDNEEPVTASFNSLDDKNPEERQGGGGGTTARFRSIRQGKATSIVNDQETLSSSDGSQDPRNSSAARTDDENVPTKDEDSPAIQEDGKSLTVPARAKEDKEVVATSSNLEEDKNPGKGPSGETKRVTNRRRSIRLGNWALMKQGSADESLPNAASQDHASGDDSQVPRNMIELISEPPTDDEKTPTKEDNPAIQVDDGSVTAQARVKGSEERVTASFNSRDDTNPVRPGGATRLRKEGRPASTKQGFSDHEQGKLLETEGQDLPSSDESHGPRTRRQWSSATTMVDEKVPTTVDDNPTAIQEDEKSFRAEARAKVNDVHVPMSFSSREERNHVKGEAEDFTTRRSPASSMKPESSGNEPENESRDHPSDDGSTGPRSRVELSSAPPPENEKAPTKEDNPTIHVHDTSVTVQAKAKKDEQPAASDAKAKETPDEKFYDAMEDEPVPSGRGNAEAESLDHTAGEEAVNSIYTGRNPFMSVEKNPVSSLWQKMNDEDEPEPDQDAASNALMAMVALLPSGDVDSTNKGQVASPANDEKKPAIGAEPSKLPASPSVDPVTDHVVGTTVAHEKSNDTSSEIISAELIEGVKARKDEDAESEIPSNEITPTGTSSRQHDEPNVSSASSDSEEASGVKVPPEDNGTSANIIQKASCSVSMTPSQGVGARKFAVEDTLPYPENARLETAPVREDTSEAKAEHGVDLALQAEVSKAIENVVEDAVPQLAANDFVGENQGYDSDNVVSNTEHTRDCEQVSRGAEIGIVGAGGNRIDGPSQSSNSADGSEAKTDSIAVNDDEPERNYYNKPAAAAKTKANDEPSLESKDDMQATNSIVVDVSLAPSDCEPKNDGSNETTEKHQDKVDSTSPEEVSNRGTNDSHLSLLNDGNDDPASNAVHKESDTTLVRVRVATTSVIDDGTQEAAGEAEEHVNSENVEVLGEVRRSEDTSTPPKIETKSSQHITDQQVDGISAIVNDVSGGHKDSEPTKELSETSLLCSDLEESCGQSPDASRQEHQDLVVHASSSSDLVPPENVLGKTPETLLSREPKSEVEVARPQLSDLMADDGYKGRDELELVEQEQTSINGQVSEKDLSGTAANEQSVMVRQLFTSAQ